ncbi:hypothetical protein [Pseudomonas cremoricolorata]|uniref:hypothetical protein n=1 Tax=Pseudomonas cremoricolorata TaxID=157783 RepID=UPI00048ADA64|nr:hypothetical protein [Pseudomonas cremoricolorata]
MRLFLLPLGLLTALSLDAQARPMSKHEQDLCSWGAQVAGQAQQAKLAGVTLYTERKRLQNRKFAKSWMRMTAFGITEQTYNSQSRLPPAEIKKTYFEQCVWHAKNRT